MLPHSVTWLDCVTVTLHSACEPQCKEAWIMQGDASRLAQVGTMGDLVSFLGQQQPSKQWSNCPDKLSEGLG